MLRKVLLLLIIIFSFSVISAEVQNQHEVDMVFCIDMSGSTNGIIPDFRNKIWDVINGIYKIRPYPALKIGVIGFSRPSFGKNDGFVKVLCELTENYDDISYQLGLLKPTIEKGDQFVGAALEVAYRMNWSNDPKALRIIYLMGNGIVSAGGYDYRKTCEDIVRKNIFINSIYCIQQRLVAKEIPGWKYISDNTGGEYFTYNISHVSPLMRISAGAQKIADLNNRLNSTYIYYGMNGKAMMNSLLDADKYCLHMGEMFYYSRVQYKASDHFQSNQSGWDLINYIKKSGTNFSSLDKSLLPDSVKNMDNVELAKYILVKKDERNMVVNQIRSYLTAIGQDTIQPAGNEFQGIILNSVNKLAKDKGYFN